jgi:Ca2+-transporting ATPase
MQLLWINLVSDVFPGLGLALEQPDPALMTRPPFPPEAQLLKGRDLPSLGLEGGVIAAGSLGALAWGVARHGGGPQASTMAFGSLVTAQLLHSLTARSDRHGPFVVGERLPANRPLLGFLAATTVLQGLAFTTPALRGVLGLAPLGPTDLAVTAACGAAPYLVNELAKGARSQRAPPLAVPR